MINLNITTDRTIPENVGLNENFYQTKPSSIGSNGGRNKARDSITKVKIRNMTNDKTRHENIDEETQSTVEKDIQNFIK